MDKIHITVLIGVAKSGYHWTVPHPHGSSASSSGDLGTAVREAFRVAQRNYGPALGNIDFQLR